jgi:hypothetical protein
MYDTVQNSTVQQADITKWSREQGRKAGRQGGREGRRWPVTRLYKLSPLRMEVAAVTDVVGPASDQARFSTNETGQTSQNHIFEVYGLWILSIISIGLDAP